MVSTNPQDHSQLLPSTQQNVWLHDHLQRITPPPLLPPACWCLRRPSRGSPGETARLLKSARLCACSPGTTKTSRLHNPCCTRVCPAHTLHCGARAAPRPHPHPHIPPASPACCLTCSPSRACSWLKPPPLPKPLLPERAPCLREPTRRLAP